MSAEPAPTLKIEYDGQTFAVPQEQGVEKRVRELVPSFPTDRRVLVSREGGRVLDLIGEVEAGNRVPYRIVPGHFLQIMYDGAPISYHCIPAENAIREIEKAAQTPAQHLQLPDAPFGPDIVATRADPPPHPSVLLRYGNYAVRTILADDIDSEVARVLKIPCGEFPLVVYMPKSNRQVFLRDLRYEALEPNRVYELCIGYVTEADLEPPSSTVQ